MIRYATTFLAFTLLLISGISGADGIRPWPFPWAKDCPMVWESLAGDYTMVGSANEDQIVVRVSSSSDGDLRTIRLVRLTSLGEVKAIGLAIVSAEEREVKVHMIPVVPDYPSSWVTLRMYYNSEVSSCDIKTLVPILTVATEANPDGPGPIFDYLLTKKN